MTFTQIKTRIMNFCGLTSPDADTRVGIAINQHYRRITAGLGLEPVRFVTRNVAMTVGQQAVTFTDIEKIDRIIDSTTATAIRLLDETSMHEIRANQPGTGQPVRWALQNTDADSVTVLTDTVPTVAYSLSADGTSTVGDMSGSDEPLFSESFHDILSFLVIAEELLKKEKIALAREFASGDEERPGRAETALRDLRFKLADSPTHTTRQGGGTVTTATGGGGGAAGNVGSSVYTQTGLITFDRDPSAPFAVTLGSAKVTNLDADKLDGLDGAAYAVVSSTLAQFASTTSLQLKTLLSDETGSGAAVFAASPSLTTPTIAGATLSGSLAGTPTFTGLFANTAFGTHSVISGGTGFNSVSLRNTTSGTGNGAMLRIGNNASDSTLEVVALSSTYTPNLYLQAGGVAIVANEAGGMSLVGAHASGALRFYAGGSTEWARITTDGGLALKDGITAPATAAGFAVIYVDSSDGDLKVKFGDGTVKTLATDT